MNRHLQKLYIRAVNASNIVQDDNEVVLYIGDYDVIYTLKPDIRAVLVTNRINGHGFTAYD